MQNYYKFNCDTTHVNEEFYIRILFIAEGLTIHVYN